MSKQQDAFLARRFGVFNHFLYSAPSSRPDTLGRSTHARLERMRRTL